MMSIGIRASPNSVWFAIVERTQPGESEILNSAEIPVPTALILPERLRFVRQTLADVVSEYGVTRAGIRLAEQVARSIHPKRMYLEGVIQELLASSPVEAYFCGAIATIARLLGEADRAAVKEFAEGRQFREIPGWEEMKKEEREAILVAVAALALGAPS